MKIKYIGPFHLFVLGLTTVLGWNLLGTSNVKAQQQYFSCQKNQGVWITFVNTKAGGIKFIHWDSNFFTQSGYTPEVRCNQVTNRLNAYFDRSRDLSIVAGKMNGQPVICVTEGKNPCQKLLYTLKHENDGEMATQLLIANLENAFKQNEGASLRVHREGPCSTHISLNALIEGKLNTKKVCS